MALKVKSQSTTEKESFENWAITMKISHNCSMKSPFLLYFANLSQRFCPHFVLPLWKTIPLDCFFILNCNWIFVCEWHFYFFRKKKLFYIRSSSYVNLVFANFLLLHFYSYQKGALLATSLKILAYILNDNHSIILVSI